MRVALAEDAVLLREGIERLLADAGFDVVVSCGDAVSLLARLEVLRADVAVLDIKMPPTFTDEGLQAALEIRERWPSTGVLVLSQYVELGLAMRLLDNGPYGLGYLLKDRITDLDEFTSALRRVGAGGSALDPSRAVRSCGHLGDGTHAGMRVAAGIGTVLPTTLSLQHRATRHDQEDAMTNVCFAGVTG